MRMALIDVQKHQRGTPLNTHEQVVEIMRNPAGQRPDGLDLLRLKELLRRNPLPVLADTGCRPLDAGCFSISLLK